MSNVQEALKAALAAIDLYDYTMTVEESEKFAKAERLCKAALAEIEKCDPVAWINPDNGALHHYELYNTYKPLYISPQPRECGNKDLLETDDGKWDATLMALWRRLQRHKNGADFWNKSEIPEDEMYIFRAHFSTALLASPLKQLNSPEV